MRLASVFLGLLMAAGSVHAQAPARFGQQPAPAQPQHVPRLAAPDGAVVGFESLLGPSPLVVNIWATWCGPCREELPALEALAAWLVPRGGRVVLIAAEQAPAEQVNRFLDLRLGIAGLDSHVDRAGQVVAAFRVDFYPTTLILDGSGRVVDVIEGTAPWDSPDARRYLSGWLAGGP